MRSQRTIKNEASISGIGLHTGKEVMVTLKPSPPDSGITFVRIDANPPCEIEANISRVVDARLATTLGKDGVTISTTEHLLGAIYGLGIDNLLIEIDSPEIPIMDGSAAPFVDLIKATGIEEQGVPREFIKILRPLKVSAEDAEISLMPSREFRITYTIDFNHQLIANQSCRVHFSQATFEREIGSARTFGLLKDLQALKTNGLAKGGSVDNAIVVGDEYILNEEGLRFPEEFVRHKVLDLIGDTALLGKPLIGHIIAHKSGHHLHHQLIREILNNQSAWKLIPPAVKRNK
ncbi:MAG: UDP-3-O-acyl-N-acetylglucosamine deacetylase [Proteobacteria bacterium]|nr:UDP-3-O-acyl-N-acetylglucosamine deacetylase [Pseudomonadota bacterium]